jgi:hypothetical protein
MTKLNFQFQDTYSFSVSKEDIGQNWKDSFMSTSGTKRVLRATIEATHAAFINRNRRWYSPSKMKDGAPTFINGNKPAKVLKHHDTHADPVGIVRGSVFVPTVPDDLINDKNVITLMSSTASMKDQISAMKNLIASGVTARKDWKGLGYIQLLVDFMDDKTIDQVDSGLFDAVSTSFSSPGHAHCFICGQNWGQDGACEHEFGEVYEDEDGRKWPMMLVPGLHLYEELSLVVQDADPHSKIKIMDEMGENIKTIDWSAENKDSLPVAKSTFEFKDFVEEEKHMTIQLTEKAISVFDCLKTLRPDAEEPVLIGYANKIAESIQEDGKLEYQVEAEIEDSLAIRFALEAIENADQVIDADAIYADIEKEIEAMKEEGLISDEDLATKKISPEERGKLSESTFCGPDRSFPVPDSVHVFAARRVALKYTGPGNKAQILAAINRKGKALGAESSDSVVSEPATETTSVSFIMPSSDSMKAATNDEVQALFAKTEVELIARKLKVARECSDCADAANELSNSQKELEAIKDSLAKAQSHLSILREELKFQQADYVHQVDRFIELESKIKEKEIEKLAIVGTLVGKYKSIDIANESLKTEDIKSIGNSIMDSFDIEKISCKINDGMAKVPGEGTIESPVIGGTNEQIIDSLQGPGIAVINNIKEMISKKRYNDARQLFYKMIKIGVLPKNLTFETVSNQEGNLTE